MRKHSLLCITSASLAFKIALFPLPPLSRRGEKGRGKMRRRTGHDVSLPEREEAAAKQGLLRQLTTFHRNLHRVTKIKLHVMNLRNSNQTLQ